MTVNKRSALVLLIVLCGFLLVLLCRDDNIDVELVFSKESGFYEEAFELELYAPPGTEIYYTLDGSEPNENSLKYTKPIIINDATDNDNIYSLRTDTSAGFLSDDIEVYSTAYPDPNYVLPNYNVDKCMVVRAAYQDADGYFSESQTASYFVDYDKKSGYEGLNVISITTDPDYLFDYDNGIYVLGHGYDEYKEGDRKSYWGDPYWCWWNANYHNHGADWEREASVQIVNAERELVLDQECGIRIQGGASRGKLPKSLNIYAREDYDEEGRFYVDLFGTDYMADTITLFAGGDDAISKIRDKVAAELTKGRDFSTMNYEPYAMFLNGEYWGVYWLTEKYDDAFLGYYYGIEKDDVIMIKDDMLAEGEEEDYKLYEEMMEYMANTDFSISSNYEYACKLLDMQSFIDYFVAEMYIGRHGDWPGGNFALWRSRKTGDGKYDDGKWRWMLYDVNSGALAGYVTDMDTISNVMNESTMFYNLCQNEDFKRQFAVTLMDMINTSFAAEKVDEVITDCIDLMSEPMRGHFKRFFGMEDSSQFQEEAEDIRKFLKQRKPYMVKYLKDDLGLSGIPARIEVETNNTEAGDVVVNTCRVEFNDKSKWQGEYYTDFPIVLTAVPDQGYRFVRWENDVSSREESITVNFDENGIVLKAVFEEVTK